MGAILFTIAVTARSLCARFHPYCSGSPDSANEADRDRFDIRLIANVESQTALKSMFCQALALPRKYLSRVPAISASACRTGA
jgi:hypothetical protein